MAAVLNLPALTPAVSGTDHSPSFYDAAFMPVDNNKNLSVGSGLLGEKIAGALKYEGYDAHSVTKVKKLVGKNTLEIGGRVGEDVEMMVKEVVEGGGVNVNSNEVVLMVEFEGIEGRKRREVEEVKNKVVEVLGDKHCIWPVRVFTAKTAGKDGVKVVLLNVVNTDVGSPSMVQLLEHHCPVKGWEDAIVSTEAWEQRNFLWRADKHWRAVDDVVDVKGPQVSQAELVHEFEHVTPVRDDISVGSDTGESSGSMVDVVKTDESASEDEYTVDEATEKSVKAAEHPALAELTAKDAERAHIQHPTWQHAGENASLIELVKMHASRTAYGDDAEAVEHPGQDLKSDDGSGFEML